MRSGAPWASPTRPKTCCTRLSCVSPSTVNSITVDNPSAFLVKTASNLAVDERRRAQVRRESPIDIGDMLDISDGQPLHPEVLAAQERLTKIMAGLDSLGPRTREIFLLHRIDGLKYREIAAQFDITVSAVEKHIAKASLFLVNWVEGE